MSWPTPNDYQEAIQCPKLCFSDRDLIAGSVALNQLGLPRVASGNFASVYKISGHATWAVRCFLRPTSDQQRRYAIISTELGHLNRPYLMNCAYIPGGIRVNSHSYPILKMAWADGDPLSTYVQRNLRNQQALLRVADKVRGIVRELQASGVAHGDLQHGNILVDASGNLRLVDYDGMFVRAFAGESSPEIGHPSFQHPNRNAKHYDQYLDTFSGLVILVSLNALAADPSLWQIFHTGENLIFTAKDFQAPRQSPVMQKVKGASDAEVRRLATVLENSCLSNSILTGVSLEQALQQSPPIPAPVPRPKPHKPSPQKPAVRPLPSRTKTGDEHFGRWVIAALAVTFVVVLLFVYWRTSGEPGQASRSVPPLPASGADGLARTPKAKPADGRSGKPNGVAPATSRGSGSVLVQKQVVQQQPLQPPAFALKVSADGTTIANGQRFRQEDPRLADGGKLVVSVDYSGVVPNETEIGIEWYVGEKPVSFFPPAKLSDAAGRWFRPYDNRIVEPGQHRVLLKINGRLTSALAFIVEPGAAGR